MLIGEDDNGQGRFQGDKAYTKKRKEKKMQVAGDVGEENDKLQKLGVS